MNIKKNNRRVYRYLKDVNYIVFLITYAVICSILVVVFEIFNQLYIHSEFINRFELGLPLILQLILTYIVYRENQETRSIKILILAVFFYTLVCGMLALYELYDTYLSSAVDLLYYVSNAQIVFQFVLALLLLICLIAKRVDKSIVVKPLFFVLYNVIIKLLEISRNKAFDGEWILWIFSLTLLINIFNPALLYILSYTAKGKLFITGNHLNNE